MIAPAFADSRSQRTSHPPSVGSARLWRSSGLAVIGFTSDDPIKIRGAYLLMAPAASFVLVPLAHVSLLSGIVLSLGSTWGLFRHYWVVLKLGMTVFATVILLIYMGTFRQMAGVAADPVMDLAVIRNASPIVHAILALICCSRQQSRRLQAVRDDRLWKTEARRAAVCISYQLAQMRKWGQSRTLVVPGLDLRGWRRRDWSGAARCRLPPDRPESDAPLAPHRHRSPSREEHAAAPSSRSRAGDSCRTL